MRRFLVGLAIWLAPTAAAALEVFACEPEWAALAQELGGSDVQVFAATTAKQDPHRIQARPSLIARMRTAGLVVCTGAELEIGWLPLLLRQAANPRVLPGQPGHFAAAEQVPLRDAPARLDRADGDVHAAGNPHVHGSPDNIRVIAVALSARLAAVDPAHAAAHADRLADFLARWDAATARWHVAAAPLRGLAVAVQHTEWVYLLEFLGMRQALTLEPKPGIPPSASHLAGIVAEVPRRQVRMILFAAYQEPRPAEFVAQRTGVPAVVLPFTVGGSDAATDLFRLFDDTVARLLAAMRASGG